MQLTQLRARLSYNPETGVFVWCSPKRLVGRVAGSKDTRGHLQIHVDGKIYAAHRLAWLFATGQWPTLEIDHKDRVKTNNRIANLRLATRSQNNTNMPIRRDNSSGVKGVSWNKAKSKWCAYVVADGKQKHLGSFALKDAAIAARLAAAKEYYGEFSTEAVAA